MPLYDYKCPTCYARREVLLKLEDLNNPVLCTHCHQPMNRQLSAPHIRCEIEPYESPVVPGKWITSRRQHEEHLKETGCRLLEPGETNDFIRRKAQEDEDLGKKVEETVDEFIAKLPTDKRDRLAGELEGGMDVQLERKTPKFE